MLRWGRTRHHKHVGNMPTKLTKLKKQTPTMLTKLKKNNKKNANQAHKIEKITNHAHKIEKKTRVEKRQ